MLPERPRLLLRELILADLAQGADEIIGKILPLGAGCDTAIGIALFFIIDPTANITNVSHIKYTSNQ